MRVAALSVMLLAAMSCVSIAPGENDGVPEEDIRPVAVADPIPVSIPVAAADPWTDEELQALALTLSGECYDFKVQDKRRVCEVVLNRVSDGRFGSSVVDVLTAENQFDGYWTQYRPVSENDYEVAEQALKDWYDGGCKALSEYLFFCAGDDLENEFRCDY